MPAGDLGYLKIVGRLKTGQRHARAEEAEVRELFEPYGEWKGLAGEYLRVAASRGRLPLRQLGPGASPSPGRNSFVNGARPRQGRFRAACSRTSSLA